MSFFTHDTDQDPEQLAKELLALERLLGELQGTLANMVEERLKKLRARTLRGQVLNVWGWVMSGSAGRTRDLRRTTPTCPTETKLRELGCWATPELRS